MYEWVDLRSIEKAAQALPNWDFVLVGPVRHPPALQALSAMGNVRIFPSQPSSVVREWMAGFDVGLIPFFQDEIAALADPIKLYEYYAVGIPVVSTVAWPLPKDVPPLHRPQSPADMANVIVQAMAQNTMARRDQRIAFARRNTWSHRAEQFLALLGNP